jgi:hypothetical protein
VGGWLQNLPCSVPEFASVKAPVKYALVTFCSFHILYVPN